MKMFLLSSTTTSNQKKKEDDDGRRGNLPSLRTNVLLSLILGISIITSYHAFKNIVADNKSALEVEVGPKDYVESFEEQQPAKITINAANPLLNGDNAASGDGNNNNIAVEDEGEHDVLTITSQEDGKAIVQDEDEDLGDDDEDGIIKSDTSDNPDDKQQNNLFNTPTLLSPPDISIGDKDGPPSPPRPTDASMTEDDSFWFTFNNKKGYDTNDHQIRHDQSDVTDGIGGEIQKNEHYYTDGESDEYAMETLLVSDNNVINSRAGYDIAVAEDEEENGLPTQGNNIIEDIYIKDAAEDIVQHDDDDDDFEGDEDDGHHTITSDNSNEKKKKSMKVDTSVAVEEESQESLLSINQGYVDTTVSATAIIEKNVAGSDADETGSDIAATTNIKSSDNSLDGVDDGGLDDHTTTNIDTVTDDINGNNTAVVEMRNDDDNYDNDIIHRRRLSLDDNSFLFDAGGYHTCAVSSVDNKLYCWGYNLYGQLGDNTTIDKNEPTEVINIGTIKQVSLGGTHTCALLDDGTLYCWGLNDKGQLGDNTTISKNEPTEVSNIGAIKQVSLGFSHTCALLDNGTLYCWGHNNYGQLGDNTTISKNEPTLVSNIGNITQVSLGNWHTCALQDDGTLYCWGRNDQGQLGLGDSGDGTERNTPTEVSNIGTIKQISLSIRHTCALLDDGTLYCWGLQLGGRTATSSNTPTLVSNIGNVKQVSLGAYHTCAVLDDGTLYCWGRNHVGQLGLGDSGVGTDMPTLVSNIGNTTQVSLGVSHTCAVLVNGTLYCWGDNWAGQLGIGNNDNINSAASSTGVLSVCEGDCTPSNTPSSSYKPSSVPSSAPSCSMQPTSSPTTKGGKGKKAKGKKEEGCPDEQDGTSSGGTAPTPAPKGKKDGKK